MVSNLYFAPEIVEDFITRLHRDKLRKEDLSLIADIVRMMTALNISCSTPKSIETLMGFLAIDKKNAKELLELTKSQPLPVCKEGKSYSVSYAPNSK